MLQVSNGVDVNRRIDIEPQVGEFWCLRIEGQHQPLRAEILNITPKTVSFLPKTQSPFAMTRDRSCIKFVEQLEF